MITTARQIISAALKAASEIDHAITPAKSNQALAVLDGQTQQHPRETNGSLLLSQAETARALNCSRWTVRNLVLDGALKPISLRGLKRFRRGDILKLAEQGAA